MFDGKFEKSFREMVAQVVKETRAEDKAIACWPPLLTVKQAAEYLGIGVTKFNELRKDPDTEIKAVFPAEGMPRFLKDDLDDYIARCPRE